MKLLALSIDLDEIPCYSAIYGLPAPSDSSARAIYERGSFAIEVPTSVPAGSTVWFRAAWTTSRGLNGPLSTAIAGYVAGALGDVLPMTLGGDAELKQAA